MHIKLTVHFHIKFFGIVWAWFSWWKGR
jgi:hypothetical protein